MLDKKKLKELVRFVQDEERTESFVKKAIHKYSDDMEFLSEVLKAPLSEVPAIHADHVMTVLEALATKHRIQNSGFSNIAEVLATKGDCDCLMKRFVDMVTTNIDLFYSGHCNAIKNVCKYLTCTDIDEDILHKIIRSPGYFSRTIPTETVSFFCAKVQKISDLDLDLVINKVLDQSKSGPYLKILLDEKCLRRKERNEQKNIETPTKEVKDEPG